jgi:glycine/D-amino acid oxidase-like deaminating enzyme
MSAQHDVVDAAGTSACAFVAGALSGYGTMCACATGALVSTWVLGGTLPDFARALSLARYDDKALMQDLLAAANTGVL